MSTPNFREKHSPEPVHFFIDTIDTMDQVQLEELMLNYVDQNSIGVPRAAWATALGAAGLAILLLLSAMVGREIGSAASAAQASPQSEQASPRPTLPPYADSVDFSNAHNGILPSR